MPSRALQAVTGLSVLAFTSPQRPGLQRP
jgi:hypothetical protein